MLVVISHSTILPIILDKINAAIEEDRNVPKMHRIKIESWKNGKLDIVEFCIYIKIKYSQIPLMSRDIEGKNNGRL